jgi:hypothetical protein
MGASMQSPKGKMHKLLEDIIEKDGIVDSNGGRCSIYENLILKIQISKERILKITLKIYFIIKVTQKSPLGIA